MEVGICEKHQRPFEALCKDCEEPVCASCVLFDLHLKHEIARLEEGSGFLKLKIKNGIDKGLMKREYCESHLLEIREYSHRMDKLRNETIKKIEDDFNTLIKALKNRKTVLMTELLDIFSKESEEIENDESKWTVNQDVSDKVLSLSKDPNDATILLNAKFIMDVIKDLNVDEQFKEIKIFNVIDTSLTLSPNTVLSYEEILFHLKNFMTILEPNNLEFRA